MKSIIPVELNILGHIVPVKFVEDLARNEGAVGMFDPNTDEIHIDARIENRAVLVTVLIHEVLEAINRYLLIDLDHDEQLVKLEAGLAQVVLQNFMKGADNGSV